MPADRSPADELAAALRRLRTDAGVSGAELARRTGYSQPTISRYERGVGPPPGMLAVGRVVWQLGLAPEVRREMVELAREVAEQRAVMTPIRTVLQIGIESVQRRIRLRERNVRHLQVYHPTIVPGLLQTERYMRLVAAAGGVDDAAADRFVEERSLRQRECATRHCTFVLPEGALFQGTPDPTAMAEQCRHLAELATTHSFWEVGVIPRVTPPGTTANITMNAFDIYDGREIFLGTTAGNALVRDQHTVNEHVTRFAALQSLAQFGEAAGTVLTRIADAYDP